MYLKTKRLVDRLPFTVYYGLWFMVYGLRPELFG